MMDIKVGQIWKDCDPRRERFVLVVDTNHPLGKIGIRTVVKWPSGTWRESNTSRLSYTKRHRFVRVSASGGYVLHEDI
jgi:hypothetical protein